MTPAPVPGNRGLTIGSLFAGIGGLELGLERGIGNGAHTVWQVEQSEYCRAVLAKHWPDATRYDDVRTVGRSNLTPVDVLCGGFPCQDISDAGNQAGIAGERSGLWAEYARIVGELRPSYVVVENVAALLYRGLGRVLGDLAAIGYDAEWDCIPAAAVGAPHRRDRLFIVAYPNGNDGRAGWPRRSDSDCARERLAVGAIQDVAHAERRRLQGRFFGRPESAAIIATALRRNRRGSEGRLAWDAEPGVGRLAHGLSARLVEHSLRALGNAVVPQVAEVVGRLIAEREALSESAA